MYTADSVRLELVELARAGGGGLVTTLGSLAWTCSDLAASAPLPYRSAGPGYSSHNKLVSTAAGSSVLHVYGVQGYYLMQQGGVISFSDPDSYLVSGMRIFIS